jgi:hypothetical protein
MGVILSLHAIHLPNFFIAAPIITEKQKKFCFRETKNADFPIFKLCIELLQIVSTAKLNLRN